MLNKLNLSIPVSKDMTHAVLKQPKARVILHLKKVWKIRTCRFGFGSFFFNVSFSRIIFILAGFVN